MGMRKLTIFCDCLRYSLDPPEKVLLIRTSRCNDFRRKCLDELVFSHGRSGVVVACILCYIFNLSPQESLNYTTKCHGNRKNMRDRWRKLGSPQNFNQKRFVHRFFETLVIYKNNKSNVVTNGFSFFSDHTIDTDLGTFNNVYNAYSQHIETYCKDNLIEDDKLDDKIKLKIMTNILKIKLSMYEDIKINIQNTGLKKIIYFSKEDSFWGNGENNKGHNYLGKLLVKIRNEYFH